MATRKLYANLLRIAGYAFSGVGALSFLWLVQGGDSHPMAETALMHEGSISSMAQYTCFVLVIAGFACTALAMVLTYVPAKHRVATRSQRAQEEQEGQQTR